jgi:hypothetical protein
MNPTVMGADRFYGGAPARLERWIGLIKPHDLKIRTRAVLIVLIGWFPLVLLAGLQDLIYGGNSLHSLLFDFGSLARYVVAAPLFIIAESIYFPIFGKIILHFRDSGLIASHDRDRYENLVQSSSKLLTSKAAEIITFAIAYAITAYFIVALPASDLISWSYVPESGGTSLSLAGKWHAIVSFPIFIVLVLGWVWRQLSWARFLWLVSRMDLQLIPTHPDRCGGLKFVSTIVLAYRAIGFAFTAIVAGGIANRMVHNGVPIQAYGNVMLAAVLLIGLFGVGPLVAFAPLLRRLRWEAIFEYGMLARNIGGLLGNKWLPRRENQPDDLEVPDFSTTTDLYSVVANIYNIEYVPVSFKTVRNLLIFIALPFVAVLLIAEPVQAILGALIKLVIS